MASGPAPAAQDASLGALVAERSAMLARYQNAALAERFQSFVARVRERESAVFGADAPPVLALAVARGYSKLLAYKDEYEVARLFSDGHFQRELQQQFEGDVTLTFHMAPPLLGKRKRAFGPWMGKLLALLARARGLRGTRFDVFGYSAERRRERQLISDYTARLDTLLPRLSAGNLASIVALAELPQAIRGYGHVKLASIDAAELRAQALLATLEQPAAAAGTTVPSAAPPAQPPFRTIAIRRYQ